MKINTLLSAVAVSALLATGASAASLTINSVSGVWTNLVPNSGISGGGTDTIAWGTPATNAGQSSYEFDGAAPPPFVANESVSFGLGTFTHNNNPITGTTLSGADLAVTVNVAGYGDILSTYSFTHVETPNGGSSCPDGGANGSGVNANGCADLVTATINLGATDTFQIGGVDYVFNVAGFSVGGSPFDLFWTTEQASNSAELLGSFVTKDSVSPVPLPAAGWMLIAGMGGLFATRRRKQAS